MRTSVSLQTTATSKSASKLCNIRRVSASSWLQPHITWFPAGEIKYSFSLEVIIKAVDLGKIPEPNLTDQLIFIFTAVQKLLPVVTLWHILFKTCNVELSERSTSFLSGNILNTVYFICVIIKPQQFHSYRIISDYEPDQCRNPFFTSFLVLSILLKP